MLRIRQLDVPAESTSQTLTDPTREFLVEVRSTSFVCINTMWCLSVVFGLFVFFFLHYFTLHDTGDAFSRAQWQFPSNN